MPEPHNKNSGVDLIFFRIGSIQTVLSALRHGHTELGPLSQKWLIVQNNDTWYKM